MSSPDNKQIVLDGYRSFATRDRHAIGTSFAADAAFIAPERNCFAVALGIRSGFQGRDAIVAYLVDDLPRLCRDSAVTISAIAADGDNVIIEQEFAATLCNGRPYKATQIYWFVIRDGLIRQVRVFFDTAKAFDQVFGDEPPRQIA